MTLSRLLPILFAGTLLAQSQPSFRVQPARPVADLMKEAAHRTPPVERGEFRPAELVDVTGLDATIRLDIRYATANNFLGTPVYEAPRAFLQRPAAAALARAQRKLSALGYGIVVHDGYRPWWVTWVFWEATPVAHRDFVADPATGSRHNRGCAIDVSLYDLKTGQPVVMPSQYDEMSERAHPDYQGGPAEARRLRDLLRRTMEAEGFTVYPVEWWHFDFKEWSHYRIGNQSFAELGH